MELASLFRLRSQDRRRGREMLEITFMFATVAETNHVLLFGRLFGKPHLDSRKSEQAQKRGECLSFFASSTTS